MEALNKSVFKVPQGAMDVEKQMKGENDAEHRIAKVACKIQQDSVASTVENRKRKATQAGPSQAQKKARLTYLAPRVTSL